MKNKISGFFCLAAITLLLQSCIKDSCKNTYHYTYYQPVYKTTAEVRANIRSNAPKPIQKPGKLYILGSYIFLNEIDKGIHVIDNSNPASPINKAFIDIPGNMDIAVKGHTLYADLYTDMVTLDITDPLQVRLTKVMDGVFPYRYYTGFNGDSTKVITDWQLRDTTVTEDCNGGGRWEWDNSAVFMVYKSSSSGGTSVSPVGMGGSMARFAIVQNRLYTVSDADLSAYNISNATQPFFTAKRSVGNSIETIYPFKNNLFIGSASGMFIYNISNPDNPTKTSQFNHVRSCDPVIADDTHAYVTLRSGTACGGFTNQMDVLNITNLANPVLVKAVPFTNPHGLSKDGNTLLVCDGKAGLKVYNTNNPAYPYEVGKISNLETYDVIAANGIAIVVAKDGLYQYNYTDPTNLTLVSKMAVVK